MTWCYKFYKFLMKLLLANTRRNRGGKKGDKHRRKKQEKCIRGTFY